MPLHSAMIDGVQVAGFRYIVYGTKRGHVSSHRTKRAAFRSLAEDARKCMANANPSDAQVYRWRDKWEVVNPDASLNLVEDAIKANGVSENEYARTIRSDSSAILESLVTELTPADLDRFLTAQGFKLSSSYHTTLRMLKEVALSRRSKWKH